MVSGRIFCHDFNTLTIRVDADKLVKASIPSTTNENPLTEDQLFGNIYIIFLGGYETGAWALTFSIIMLAIRLDIQAEFHADLDRALKEHNASLTDPSSWSYRDILPSLLSGYAGAILQETNRLYGALPVAPKTNASTAQPIRLKSGSGEKDCVIPPHTSVNLFISAAARNPKYWPEASVRPTREPKTEVEKRELEAEGEPYPVSTFDPRLWLKSKGKESFTPVPGSYYPFSGGSRPCVGKRFAEIEIVAVLASMFAEYQVELEPVEGEGDEKIGMEKARLRAIKEMSTNVGFIPAIKLTGKVPLRFVKRR